MPVVGRFLASPAGSGAPDPVGRTNSQGPGFALLQLGSVQAQGSVWRNALTHVYEPGLTG
jgi:hypothetical protein